MNVKTIEIVVSPEGKTSVETKGFVGSDCRQASRFIEQALGKQVDEQLSSEFYANSIQQQQLREGQ